MAIGGRKCRSVVGLLLLPFGTPLATVKGRPWHGFRIASGKSAITRSAACPECAHYRPGMGNTMDVRDFGANGRPFRIAQVAPLYESVPSPLYGGTERVVSYLTEALVSQGHEVTLFASGDSVTKARLIAPCPRGLRLDDLCQDHLAYHMLLLEQVIRHAHRFDLIHFHIDYLHYPFSRRCS